MSKPILRVVSLSGGKDSSCMLLMMIEKKMPIDIVLYCDTTLDFPAMYEHLDKLEKTINMPITRVRADKPYEYYFFEAPVKRKHEAEFSKKFGPNHNGYGWAGPRMRWCTSVLKDTPRERFLRPLREKYEVKEYIGIAADETYRLNRKRNQDPNHIHPLVEWGMTEADCLKYCYDHGFYWGGLYEHFKRVSCWCCPLQSLPELRKLHQFFPELWEKLKSWDELTWRKFRADYSVKELEARFDFEDECIKLGKPIKGKAFYTELRGRLNSGQ